MSLRVHVRLKLHWNSVSMLRLIPFFMKYSNARRQEMCVCLDWHKQSFRKPKKYLWMFTSQLAQCRRQILFNHPFKCLYHDSGQLRLYQITLLRLWKDLTRLNFSSAPTQYKLCNYLFGIIRYLGYNCELSMRLSN